MSSNNDQFSEDLVNEIVDSQEENKKEIVEKVEQKLHNEVEREIKHKVMNFYFWIVIILFILSNAFIYFFIYIVFNNELTLITENLMDVQHRSINSTTISILIAATIAQVGAAFFAIAKFLFSA